MSKQIIIVGGGISGLTALHYLRQKYQDRADVRIKLLEMQYQVGGKLGTVLRNNLQYETGPNGILDSNRSTMTLAEELGLAPDLVPAHSQAKTRYLCIHDVLYAMPSSLSSFLKFKFLSLSQKLRIVREIFLPNGQNSLETVYDFGCRRFGEGFAKYILDPMVSGIFGGDSRELNLQSAFPRIYELEQEYGSIIFGLLKSKKKNQPKEGIRLWSFKNGMGALGKRLSEKYGEFIQTGAEVSKISKEGHGYRIETPQEKYFGDEVILAVPAHEAADLLNGMDPVLAKWLCEIPYAALVVVGLVYDEEQFERIPEGLGYLRPTHEGKEVLGVLFSSNIFPSRAPRGRMLFQVMLGGAKHPETIRKSEDELIDLAKAEIKKILKVRGDPKDQFLARWGKAIPQYNRSYPQIREAISGLLTKHPHFHLLANYLDGISVNDCTANAKLLAEKIVL